MKLLHLLIIAKRGCQYPFALPINQYVCAFALQNYNK